MGSQGVEVPFARVTNISKDVSLADRAEVADTSARRRTGLLKHESLPPGSGLWIVPTEGVHTIGMKFAIDVLFLNRRRQVVKIRPNMGKWKLALSLRAHSVLELPAGTVANTGTAVGDQLSVDRIPVE